MRTMILDLFFLRVAGCGGRGLASAAGGAVFNESAGNFAADDNDASVEIER